MNDISCTFGGGMPTGWCVRHAAKALKERTTQTETTDLTTPVLLVGGDNQIDPSDWPVPDQGTRGTCSAFAIAAAEELLAANRTGTVTELSKEFLYACMRFDMFRGLADAGVVTSELDKREIEETGGTFLLRGKQVLATHGVCRESLLPYDKDRTRENFSFGASSLEALDDACARVHPEEAFENDITITPSTGDDRVWAHLPNDTPLSDIFVEKLRLGYPVVASFAILSGDLGQQSWFGRRAVKTGIVKYPRAANAAQKKPVGGHSVCIIGVGRRPGSNGSGPWFMFRNSLGPERFATKAPTDRPSHFEHPPGYGIISARSVDLYCWEHLTLAGPADS